MKKAHGEHNEALCQKLLSENVYKDWVVTTAFYSAIHFIDYKLFPLEHDGKIFNNISDIRRHLNSPSPHAARKRIVSIYLADQVANYDFLDKNCRNARYNNYAISLDKAQKASQRLALVKSACL